MSRRQSHQGGAGQDQRDEDGAHDREDDLFRLGDRAQLSHLDLTLFFGGERFHDGRLYDRYQGHIAVGRHSDRAQQMRGQLGGDIE